MPLPTMAALLIVMLATPLGVAESGSEHDRATRRLAHQMKRPDTGDGPATANKVKQNLIPIPIQSDVLLLHLAVLKHCLRLRV